MLQELEQEKKKLERRSLTITPAFDPTVMRWFVEEFPGIESPTLCELLKQLPRGTKIKNYYPTGTSSPKQRYRRATKVSEMRPHVIPAFGYKSSR